MFGCSKKSVDAPPNDGLPHNVATNGLPFVVTVVETSESKEWNDITLLAQTYFNNKEYDKLEELAMEYRSVEESWADGTWKVVPVYVGLEVAESEPDSVWLARQKALKDWIQARPESITARVELARNLTFFAWKARGSGYANTVSEDAGKLFCERLQQAANVLHDAASLNEKCPVYWTTLMKIALGLQASKTQFDNIFKQAVRAYPSYTPIYIQRAVYLLPRWYGNAGDWETDLAQSADQLGGTKGDMLYAQVVLAMRGYSDRNNIFEDNQWLSWERVDRGWDELEKKFPDSLDAIHAHAHLAGLAGDQAKAKQCLMKTGGKVTLSQWSSKGEFVDFANWALGQ